MVSARWSHLGLGIAWRVWLGAGSWFTGLIWWGCPLQHMNRRVTGRPSLCLTLRSEGKQEVPAAQKSPGLAWNVGWAAVSRGLKCFCHHE